MKHLKRVSLPMLAQGGGGTGTNDNNGGVGGKFGLIVTSVVMLLENVITKQEGHNTF